MEIILFVETLNKLSKMFDEIGTTVEKKAEKSFGRRFIILGLLVSGLIFLDIIPGFFRLIASKAAPGTTPLPEATRKPLRESDEIYRIPVAPDSADGTGLDDGLRPGSGEEIVITPAGSGDIIRIKSTK